MLDPKDYNDRLTVLTDRAIEAVETNDVEDVDPIRHAITELGEESGYGFTTSEHFQRLMSARGYEGAF